ncbi:UDP-glucose 4-epimerase GalE [Terasakiella pusilla]|uniref:UDP-glucose 4-epimerase GalE n=1 Tax=Terasakiella pusilla TaxID=64973 RepID=UPI003AA92D31
MGLSKKVLVTGGAGYIGSHVCKALDQAGHIPVTFDNLSTGHRDFVKWGPLCEGDITNLDDLDRAFVTYEPDCVMHFAASSYVRESVVDPMKYYTNNCIGSLRLLEAMQRHGVTQIVFSSTCAVYGDCPTLPIDESARQLPASPYGRSKQFVETAIKDLAAVTGLKWVALRYFNAAGADPEGEVGESHDPETHIIPRAIQAALGLGPALEVYGSDFETADGTAIRDYIHVKDLAAAHIAAMTYLEQEGASGVYNLGTGKGTSALEILRAVEKYTGTAVPHAFVAKSDGDVPALYASPVRAQTDLKWEARYSSIDQIIETALAWHKKSL